MRKRVVTLLLAFVVLLSVVLPAAVSADGTVTKLQVVHSVSFRDHPSTSSSVMRYLQPNEAVTALEMVNPYWYRIEDANGEFGYVTTNSDYVHVKSNATVVGSVNLRSQPTLNSARIRLMAPGEELYISEKVNAYWYKAVDMNGTEGYVSTSSKYVQTDFSVSGVKLPLGQRIEAVIAAAQRYMGTPYEFGSKRFDTTTFDCSDLVQQSIWDATRVVIPSNSSTQGEYVKGIGDTTADWHQLKRGDLMFFMSYKGSSADNYAGIDKSAQMITHVGIYLGNGYVLHTYSGASGGVKISSIVGNAWEYRFLFGGSAMN